MGELTGLVYCSAALRPNVLLIVFDTARADAFEPYGAPPGSTPTVAQLAGDGVVAPGVIAPSSWTVPSHAAMFTGLLPRTIGLVGDAGQNPKGFEPAMRAQSDRLLSTVLGKAGYRTGAVSANLWVSSDSGFDTGFDTFHNVRSERRAKIGDRTATGRWRWRLEVLRARADDGATAIEAMLDDWITTRRPDEPFFWFVNLVECHSPYLPPAPYCDVGPVGRVRAADDAQEYQTFQAFALASLGKLDVDASALARMHHLYTRAVLMLDDWLARALDRLDAARVLDDTLVLVTSDHGENFGENHLTGHSFSLDQRLIHVPFVARGPGSGTFADAISLVDVPRRLAAALAVDDHPWQPQLDVPGVAVSQLDPPGVGEAEAVEQKVRELGLDERARARLVTPLTCAIDGRWKLVARGDVEELFDLASDPLEERPLDPSSAPDAPLTSLRAAVDGARGGEASRVVHTGVALRDDDLEDRLRLLGYL